MSGHFTAQRGKRVLVLMKNGAHFEAKYLKTDYKQKLIYFSDHDPVALNQLRTLAVARGSVGQGKV